jgi:hypothetical protein
LQRHRLLEQTKKLSLFLLKVKMRLVLMGLLEQSLQLCC